MVSFLPNRRPAAAAAPATDYGESWSVGFNESYEPCCTLGRIRPTLTCTPLSSLCNDRSKYVFWDEYHPTDRTNEIIALAISRKLGIVPVNTTAPPNG